MAWHWKPAICKHWFCLQNWGNLQFRVDSYVLFHVGFPLVKNDRGTHDKRDFSASSWGLRKSLGSIINRVLFGKMSLHSSPEGRHGRTRRTVEIETWKSRPAVQLFWGLMIASKLKYWFTPYTASHIFLEGILTPRGRYYYYFFYVEELKW